MSRCGRLTIVLLTAAALGACSGDDGFDTAGAADRLDQVLQDAPVGEVARADLEECPAGPAPDVLDEVATAIGGDALRPVLADGEVAVRALLLGPQLRLAECTADLEDVGTFGMLATTQPTAFLEGLDQPDQDDPSDVGYDEVGTGRAGTFAARCERDGADCAVVWYDDRLLVGIGGGGPAFQGVGVDQLRGALDELLPSLVDGLAG